ncbi:unnamed protein product [Lepeophtheirus salmonis]|uniref:(salmon louse) hypothetical protein n=1 Tax=Lepeophtheirus salmonis TaxID=72036 RepID=A0A7R8CCG7_LEPSM|nr:unnamed protein product [Lepeophtheirus salmonis]CAF2765694.1 unnamed protein product [Lepeophtheirus salmonis]
MSSSRNEVIVKTLLMWFTQRWSSSFRGSSSANFGLMFDIDGVLYKILIVPTVFVTNAGNSLRQTKARQLSDWLGVNVSEDQVIMSHSPLKMFNKYHDKHVLNAFPLLGLCGLQTTSYLAPWRAHTMGNISSAYFRYLKYTALVGKPSEITYRHGESVLQEEAHKCGRLQPIEHIYFIGDNICTDIYGANLYNHHLLKRRKCQKRVSIVENNLRTRSMDLLLGDEDLGATNCFSVLVETGVYSSDRDNIVTLQHSPRDFLPVEDSYRLPTLVAKNVLEAIELIFEREEFE